DNTYTYNDKGQLIKEEENSVSEIYQTSKDVRRYEYDTNGNLIKKIEEGDSTNEIQTYTYDKKNQLIKEETSRLDLYKGKRLEVGTIYYEYDDRGNKIKVRNSLFSDGYAFYKYNNLNQLIEYFNYRKKNKF